MGNFVYCGRDYVNLDKADRYRMLDDGWYEIEINGEVERAKSIDEGLVSISSCQGEWECLVPVANGEERLSVESFSVEPVLAWGLRPLGHVVPITPFELSGAEGNYAIRRKDESEVRDNFGDIFKNAEAWLDHVKTLPLIT